jgi:hypothetical protein
MTYTSLEQRLAKAYLDMLPAFVPDEQAEVSIDEQLEFYHLMKNLYQLLFDEPALIIPTLHEDDAFPTRYKKAYGKPDLQENIYKYNRTMDALLKNMFSIGCGNDVKLNKRQIKILTRLGIEDLSNLPATWIWMSKRPGANLTAFAYCLFNENHVYSSEVYARLLGEKVFRRLEDWMISHGYKAYDIYNTDWADYRLTLTYANPAWGKERPNGGYEYKIRHTGISVQYDSYVRNPVSFGLCIPYGLKLFLENFNSMDENVKDFVVNHTKKCDGCRYCVQTDKTSTRPLACIPVTYNRSDYKLCPYFPGYGFSWTSIDDNLVDNIIALLSFMDGFAKQK